MPELPTQTFPASASPPAARDPAPTLPHSHISSTGVVFSLLTLAGWSSVPLFLFHFSHTIDSWTSNGWRYLMSALFWAPVLVWAHSRGVAPKHLWTAALVPALFNTLGQVTFALAHYYLAPGVLTFVFRVQIVFVALGAYLLFPAERLLLRFPVYWCGFVAVLLGSAGVAASGESFAGATAIGVVISVISGLFFAAYWLSVRKYVAGMNPIVSFAAISQYTAIALVVLMLAFAKDHGSAAFAYDSTQWLLLFASSLAGIALGHVFYYASIARMGVAVSSGVVQLQPVVVTAASFALYPDAVPTRLQLLFGVVAVFGAIIMVASPRLMARRDRRRRAHRADHETVPHASGE